MRLCSNLPGILNNKVGMERPVEKGMCKDYVLFRFHKSFNVILTG